MASDYLLEQFIITRAILSIPDRRADFAEGSVGE
jgi:hypothetical protein